MISYSWDDKYLGKTTLLFNPHQLLYARKTEKPTPHLYLSFPADSGNPDESNVIHINVAPELVDQTFQEISEIIQTHENAMQNLCEMEEFG